MFNGRLQNVNLLLSVMIQVVHFWRILLRKKSGQNLGFSILSKGRISMNVPLDNMHKCLVLFFNKIKTETVVNMGTTGGGGGGNFTTGRQARTHYK